MQVELDPFLPTTLLGWLAIILGYGVTVAGAARATWSRLVNPIREELKRETESRTKADAARDEVMRETANIVHAAIGRVEVLERNVDRLQSSNDGLHEDVVSLVSEMRSLTNALHAEQLSRTKEMGDLKLAIAQQKGVQ
jgi:hypothetical protein